MIFDFSIQSAIVVLNELIPYKSVFIGIYFDFCPIQEVILHLYVFFLLYFFSIKNLQLRKKIFYDTFHIQAEMVNCSKVWFVASGNPHEVDIFPKNLGNLPGRIELLRIGINQIVHNCIYDPHQMTFRYEIFKR
jgi:hypothetical protein